MRKLLDWWRGRRISALKIRRAGLLAIIEQNDRGGITSPYEAGRLDQVNEEIRQIQDLRHAAFMQYIDALLASVRSNRKPTPPAPGSAK